MTTLIQKKFAQISLLSEDEQNTLATYLNQHLNELLQKAEKEKRIKQGNYNINDFNEKTQQVIFHIETGNNLTICDDKNDLYNQLGI